MLYCSRETVMEKQKRKVSSRIAITMGGLGVWAMVIGDEEGCKEWRKGKGTRRSAGRTHKIVTMMLLLLLLLPAGVAGNPSHLTPYDSIPSRPLPSPPEMGKLRFCNRNRNMCNGKRQQWAKLMMAEPFRSQKKQARIHQLLKNQNERAWQKGGSWDGG